MHHTKKKKTTKDPAEALPAADCELLVVEDDLGVSHLIQRALRRAGYKTSGVNTGSEALRFLAEQSVTLILLDYRLPDMTGKEVIQSLHFDGIRVPFMLITGAGDERIAVDMMKLGAMDYVMKEAGFMDVLPHVVRRLVEQITAEHDLRETEQALYQSEERFSVLFRESSDPILILSMKDEIESVNPAFERILAAPLSLRLTWEDFVVESDLPHLQKALKERGDVSLLELRLETLEGVRWFEMRLSRIHDRSGRACGRMAVARDVTSRKHREIRLREETKMIRQRHMRSQELINRLTHFVSEINNLPHDINGYLRGVCTILFEIYGPYLVFIHVPTRSQTIYCSAGHLPEESIQEDGTLVIAELLERAQRMGTPIYSHDLKTHPSFSQAPSVRQLDVETCLGAPLTDSSGDHWGCICVLDKRHRDFSHLDIELMTVAALQVASRLRADEHHESRRELEDHLRQAQKMEAVGMLAGGIAHDFNNALSGILGFSSYLLSKTEEGSNTYRYLTLIEKSAVQASELTKQLLAFSRRTTVPREVVCMNDVISEVIGILKHSLSKKIAIQQELAESLPNVKGDRGQLTQVIMNLCLNAADAMNEGDGEILMRTESRPLTERERNTLLDVGGGSYICITVADNGMGMDEHVRKHIFDPFFTTKAGQGGSGLGLSIVYGIVNNHQGEISLESETGEGTTFRIYLPVFLGEKVEAETIEEPPARGNETVLIIDDEQIVREMVAAILKDFGYTAITASGGEEGLEKLKEAEGAVDLVLLDMVMPGMDGPQTFDAIKAQWEKVPILLTTGFAEGDQCIRLMDAGARGLVRKPYKSRDLLKTVRKVLNDVRRERVAKSKGRT